MKPRILNGILICTAILLWIVIMAFHMAEHMAARYPEANLSFRIGDIWYRISMVGFLLTNSTLISRLFGNIEKLHVTTLLWRLFIIGMVGITLIMFITFANRATTNLITHPYLRAIYFGIGLYAIVAFFLCAVFIFKRFILYPRSRRKLIAWRIFLGFLGLSIFFLFDFQQIEFIYLALGSYIPFVILSLFLSANVRWIAYLNFNQKLRALGLLVLLVIVISTYIIAALRLPPQLGMGAMDSIIFLNYLIIFTIIYSVFSILVLFFNLPTSSIFEMQGVEIASFSKINQAIQSNLDFTEIMDTLLEAAMMASNARGGWVEMISPNPGLPEVKASKKITLKEIREIKQHEDITEEVLRDQKPYLIKNTRKHKTFRNNSTRFKCLLAVPIFSNSQAFGAVYVVNEIENSFEDVAITAINTYAEQASIALENAQLVQNSIEMERYQEQLKIAKEVQSKLLPRQLPYSDKIEFVAMSENAYEVGGDYFDVVQPHEHLYRVAIGDVSGKGTTAAFYMAEIKGIFHALTQLDLGVRQFINTANRALSQCMQKGFFMTLTYLQIDVRRKEIEMIRAGHCPAFLYKKDTNEISILREGTLGLGIVRSGNFLDYISSTELFRYQPGDLLVLYTDGIIEARNAAGEEFGYKRFQTIIENHKDEATTDIASSIVREVKEFSQGDIADDYTVLVIKLK